MSHLTRESLQFEGLMTSAKAMMSGLGEKSAALPGVAARLENIDRNTKSLSPNEARRVGELLVELYTQYTMGMERAVHLKQSDRFGIIHKPSISRPDTHTADTEEVLFCWRVVFAKLRRTSLCERLAPRSLSEGAWT